MGLTTNQRLYLRGYLNRLGMAGTARDGADRAQYSGAAVALDMVEDMMVNQRGR